MSDSIVNERETVNAREAAEALGVSENTLTDYLERGMIEGAYRPFKGMAWIIPAPVRLRERPKLQAFEVMEILNRARPTLHFYRKRGWLTPEKHNVGGQEVWLYDRDDVEQLADKLRRKDAGEKGVLPE